MAKFNEPRFSLYSLNLSGSKVTANHLIIAQLHMNVWIKLRGEVKKKIMTIICICPRSWIDALYYMIILIY